MEILNFQFNQRNPYLPPTHPPSHPPLGLYFPPAGGWVMGGGKYKPRGGGDWQRHNIKFRKSLWRCAVGQDGVG